MSVAEHLVFNPWLHWWTDSAPVLHQATFPRLLLAMLLGACVGAERQWRQRAAGLRTNTLVCFGAAAFVDLGMTIAPGAVQIIAYVVSGVGFLGAGAIMKDGANVRGLNTAATLWCSAAVGACVGAGEMLDGVFVTILLITINSVLRPLARYIDGRSLAVADSHILYRLQITCNSDRRVEAESQIVNAIASTSFVLKGIRTVNTDEEDTTLIRAILETTVKNSIEAKDLIVKMRLFSWALSVEWTESGQDQE